MEKETYKSRQVLEMLTVANEFCHFVESYEDYDKSTLLDFLQKIGPLLYLKGMLLPDVNVNYPEANERFITEEQWENLFISFRNILKDEDEYYYVPIHGESDLVKASLSENLTDIYQDLKDFIMLYQKNTIAAQENAAAECKGLFKVRWGKRLISLLLYLHIFRFQNESDDALFDLL